MSVSITRVVKFIRKGDKGDDGKDAVVIYMNPPTILHKKTDADATYAVTFKLKDGDGFVRYGTSLGEFTGGDPGGVFPTGLGFRKVAAADNVVYHFTIAGNSAVNADLTIVIRYKGTGYARSLSIRTVADGKPGSPGAKGDRGPALRGPQAWDDCAVGYVFQSGADGEDFKDVVLYNNNYYSCVKSHAKAADNAPLSTADTSNGYWKLADKFEVIATKILLAQYALVKNLGVEAVEMKNDGGEVVFRARGGNVICNNGVFNNIRVNGDIMAKSLRLKVVQDNAVTDGAVACASGFDPVTLPELEKDECLNIKISAPLITRSSPPAEVKPKNNKVKIWVHGSNDAPVSKIITLGYGLFDAVGIGYDSGTVWAIR